MQPEMSADMAADPFQKLSPDHLHYIFLACDKFSDMLALAASCKGIYATWVAQSQGLIWQLASTQILAFDSALMAVRATKIVADAQRDGVEPPHPFPVRELSGSVKKPLPAEMKMVREFEHLIKCVERMMVHWKVDFQLDIEYSQPLLLDEKGHWIKKSVYPIWRERIHRGLYHVLLAGAVCSRPYNAPFVRALKEGRTDFLDRCARCTLSNATLTDDDIDFLRKFPVYNFHVSEDSNLGQWRDKEYESLFGPLAEWLIQSGAKIGTEEGLPSVGFPVREENQDDDWTNAIKFDSRQTGSIREIKTVIGAYEHFHRKVSRTDYSDPAIPENQRTINFQGQKQVTAVIFGLFQLDEVSMPKTIEESDNGFLFAKPTTGFPLPSRAIDLRAILFRLSVSSRRNDYDNPPAPQFELFSFILRKYFNLKLEENTFDPEWRHPEIWLHQLARGDIFELPADFGWFHDSLVVNRIPVS